MLRHTPVLLQEIIDATVDSPKMYLDGTIWHAGHTQALLQAYPEMQIIWIDRDDAMIKKAKIFLELEDNVKKLDIVKGRYDQFDIIKSQTWVEKFDMMLLDIWVNMDHFKVAERGFSIKLDGDLDMRYDITQGVPVRRWLEMTHFEELVDIFRQYTDFWQRYREDISRKLVAQRKSAPFKTTHDVRKWAKENKINDKVLAIIFQTWRIFINDELGALKNFLATFTKFLNPWWRCCIISYHSWEDRLVKYSFKELVDNDIWILYNRKVIQASRQEKEKNRASRSAKLRIFEKK